MKITDLLKKDTCILDLKATSKEEVIDELIDKLESVNKIEDKIKLKNDILKREKQGSTGLGDGIAIPHAKTSAVSKPIICFGRSKKGLDYNALDNQPVNLFFMIAAPEGANNVHLETLSRLATLLMDEEFKNSLLDAKSVNEILELVDAQEKNSFEKSTQKLTIKETDKFVLAVTACPTGIAHTYMAADALKNAAEKANVNIKVETNGSGGTKNILSKDEIDRATGIIVAADKNVDMVRFAGKRLIQVKVADGIKKADQLIERVIKQDAPIYNAKEDNLTSHNNEKLSIGATIYKHIMSGVSNMLPFVVGGGILIAISFIFGIDPESGTIGDWLMNVGGNGAFGFMIPILSAFIAMSIADRPGFMPGMVGGWLAASGDAGFLGGILAGFAAGYIIVYLKKGFEYLPEALNGIKAVLLYPVFGLLFTAIIVSFIINPPMAFLDRTLYDWVYGMQGVNIVLLGLILGGMMAVDLGGPINKVAFTFGTAMITAGNFGPHAAVMAGGMVPPLGIAISTTIFRKKYTISERKAGITNYVMGASFITEGAIPFAATDPIRVLVSCIIGSATAGALVMTFNVTLMAPHGGMFVLPIAVTNVFLYILAILIGSLITAFMLGFWKKEVKN